MKNEISRNILASLLLQFITIISGLVIPKIILVNFGSNINGMVSSLNQFLNYISLLEGGLSGVVMASLYKPLVNKDEKKISAIIKVTSQFLKKIAKIYILYTLAVSILYPLFVNTGFSWNYVFILTIILSFNLFIQYFFSLTYRLLLNADRKGYIVSYAQMLFIFLNMVLTIVAVNFIKSIHLVKLVSTITFIVQPVIFSIYVKKHYHIEKDVQADKAALSQRWDGFGQNFAFFIHTNTDIVLITIFMTLKDVSVYSVYLMVANSLKSIAISVSGAISPFMGKALVTEKSRKNEIFDQYTLLINILTTFLFSCGILLIVPFIKVYTLEITDTDYIQPLFGITILLAEAVYCYRDPYVNVAYASGHFKQTAAYAYLEALVNIIISVIAIKYLGILGVAIGTLISMIIRMVLQVLYIKKNILYRPVKKWVKSMLVYMFVLLLCILSGYIQITKSVTSYTGWFFIAIISAAVCAVIIIIVTFICYKSLVLSTINRKK
ncbi:MAG: oligosaccharide flippase family protein [Lachnospiraceae bacterium]